MVKRVAILFAVPLLVCSVLRAAPHEITGVVRDQAGEPIRGAVVEIEDMRTLMVRSFITPRSGKYRFAGVESDQAYRLNAHYRSHWSRNRRLSRFDLDKPRPVSLTIRVPVE